MYATVCSYIIDSFIICTLVKFVSVSTFCGSSNETDFSMTGALVGGGFIAGASNDNVDYNHIMNDKLLCVNIVVRLYVCMYIYHKNKHYSKIAMVFAVICKLGYKAY